jgi:gliding motility-associated-like protein
VQINGNPPWNISYSINGNIAVYTQHQSDSIVNISLQQNYYEIYFVQITDNSNCAIQVPTDTLRIWAFNPVSAHSSSMEICGLTATLQAQPPTEGIGRWILPSTMTCNNIHLYNAQVYSSLYGTFPIVWEVTNGPCIDTNQTTITFYEQPMQPYAGVDLTLYDANAIVVMSASAPTAGIGTWTVIQGQATFTDVHHPNTQVTGFAEGDNLLRWMITNGICNPVYDDVLIRLFSIIVPEGFSPNGDGKNDYFEIKGIDGTIAYHLMVFNRWGNIVYESNQYQNNWNGKDNQGRDLPDDTYFYMLNKDDKLLKSGYLILKR